MNKNLKKYLEEAVTAFVKEDAKTTQSAFHKYFVAKTQEILLGEKECTEEMADDEVEEKKEPKKSKKDKEDKKEEKDEKEDKKPPFFKKSKKEKKEDE